MVASGTLGSIKMTVAIFDFNFLVDQWVWPPEKLSYLLVNIPKK